MIEFVVASLLAALTVAYWALCRSRSLPLRQKASQLVTEYIERDDVTESDAKSMYGAYSLATKCWFLPVAVVFSLVIMPYLSLVSKPGDKPTPEDKRKIMASCLMFHVVRNPIISVICLSAIFVWTMVFVAGGLLSRRLTSVPSLSQLLDVVSMLKPERDKHAH